MNAPNKPTKRRSRQRLADPVTYAAMDAAMAAGRARFDPQMLSKKGEIDALLNGRSPKALGGGEAVALAKLMAEFNALAVEQQKFVMADLHARLNPDDGSEMVEA